MGFLPRGTGIGTGIRAGPVGAEDEVTTRVSLVLVGGNDVGLCISEVPALDFCVEGADVAPLTEAADEAVAEVDIEFDGVVAFEADCAGIEFEVSEAMFVADSVEASLDTETEFW